MYDIKFEIESKIVKKDVFENGNTRIEAENGCIAFYNKENMLTYQKEPDGTEYWFDDDGDLKAIRNSEGVRYFDKTIKDNLIHIHEYTDFNNYECDFDYEKITRLLVHAKNSHGAEHWYKYDQEGNQIYGRTESGFEAWYTKKGNPWKIKFTNGFKLYGVFIIKLYELLFLKED